MRLPCRSGGPLGQPRPDCSAPNELHKAHNFSAPGLTHMDGVLTTHRSIVAMSSSLRFEAGDARDRLRELAVLVVAGSAVLWKHRGSSTARKNSEI
jgi:hypothetical protein